MVSYTRGNIPRNSSRPQHLKLSEENESKPLIHLAQYVKKIQVQNRKIQYNSVYHS